MSRVSTALKCMLVRMLMFVFSNSSRYSRSFSFITGPMTARPFTRSMSWTISTGKAWRSE